jgi:hypothetical protein
MIDEIEFSKPVLFCHMDKIVESLLIRRKRPKFSWEQAARLLHQGKARPALHLS